MEKKGKGQRGGTRAGAGRPNLFGQRLRERKVFLTDELNDWVEREASENEITPSHLIRECIKAFRGK